MTWVCRKCNSNNPGSALFCEVCGCRDHYEKEGVLAREFASFLPLERGMIIIPEDYTEIGESAFEGNSGLETVVLGKGIKKINDKAFKNCENLCNVIVTAKPDYIGHEAFYNDRKLTVKSAASFTEKTAFLCEHSYAAPEPPVEPKVYKTARAKESADPGRIAYIVITALLVLAAFISGQVKMHTDYSETGKVEMLSSLIPDMQDIPFWWLIASGILSFISFAACIWFALSFDEETDSKPLKWLVPFAEIFSLIYAPAVLGPVMLITIIPVTLNISEGYDYDPEMRHIIFYPAVAFIISHIFMWVRYVTSGSVVFISEYFEVGPVFLAVSSFCGLVAAAHTIMKCVDLYENDGPLIWFVILTFGFSMLLSPCVSSVFWIIVSSVLLFDPDNISGLKIIVSILSFIYGSFMEFYNYSLSGTVPLLTNFFGSVEMPGLIASAFSGLVLLCFEIWIIVMLSEEDSHAWAWIITAGFSIVSILIPSAFALLGILAVIISVFVAIFG